MKKSLLSSEQFKRKLVNRVSLMLYMSKKLRGKVLERHIVSVTSILIKELFNELIDKEVLKIKNFGEFFFKQFAVRKYHDYQLKKMVMSSGNKKILKFELSTYLKNMLIKKFDVTKTPPATPIQEPKDGEKGT